MTHATFAGRAGLSFFLAALLLAGSSYWLHAETVTLKNGMTIDGSLGKISSMGADPLKAVGVTELKQIVLLDNQLTRTFVGSNQVAAITIPPAPITEKFLIQQRVAVAGRTISSVGPIARVTPFDEWGRRIFTMNSNEGPVDIVQGITEITPTYTKVEAVQGAGSYILTQRIATSSIPRQTLSKVLWHDIDPTKSDDRLKIVKLYLQAERIQDARAELEQLIEDFPELDRLKDQVKTLQQVGAQRVLKEVELRRAAGQYQRAIVVLQQFPAEGIAGETLLKVREMLDEMAGLKAEGDNVQILLKTHMEAIKEEKTREDLKPIIDEITAELNVNTLDRMADYLRLQGDATLTPEQKLSLAISGWLLGSGAGVDNLAVSQSLVEVRDLVQQYLASNRKPERDNILLQLESHPGASPDYVAKLLAHMKPPLEKSVAAEEIDPGDAAKVLGLDPAETAEEPAEAVRPVEKPVPAPAAPKPAAVLPKEAGGGGCDDPVEKPLNILDDEPAPRKPAGKGKASPKPAAGALAKPEAPARPEVPAAAGAVGPVVPTGTPGLFEITVAGLPEEPQIKYWLQLPPEYDPYRRYPCVVTLNGAGTTPLQQIDWWAGGYNSEVNNRFGQASRHGYIVLAPRWTREHQRKYEFSAREHAAVLYTLRDACKRFSIDTDRVFLSGHSMGGDAAWDIGLAHPDLWAGVIPIVAVADKYVKHRYQENGKYVPMYFVCGEKDGNKLALNSSEWDYYLKHIGYDVMVVQYQGRGHEHFHDEIQRLFDWMNLHNRNFFPKQFTVYSMRPWDNFFWWVETDKPRPANIVLPVEWPGSARPYETEGRVLETNAVSVTSGADKVTVWLAPEIVNFEGKVTVHLKGKRHLNVQPSIATMLEDARTRADRQHPFWAKVSN